MNKTRFEDPVHDPVAVHDPDRCVRDCLSVTCASVGGLWDTASGTYFPAARAGYWEVSAENTGVAQVTRQVSQYGIKVSSWGSETFKIVSPSKITPRNRKIGWLIITPSGVGGC